jgi:beta-lactamase class A
MTSPLATLRALLLGDALCEPSHRQLRKWLIEDKFGDGRIRAGLPQAWRVGDKAGAGDNGATNTIAIL